MARPLRPIAENLIYHVMNRGNNRQDVFVKAADCEAFLNSMRDLRDRRPFELYGFCLMANHFHLLIKPLETSISRIMQSLLVSHTGRCHKAHRSVGHVWQGRFKSPVIQDDDHLLVVLRYIEANPVRAKIVERAGDYEWSSYTTHGLGVADDLLSPCLPYEQLSPYPAVRKRRWDAYVHKTPDREELAAIRRSLDRSLPLGSAEWVDGLARELNLDLTIRPRGRPRKKQA